MNNIVIPEKDFKRLLLPLEELHDCRICPRNCGADRFTSKKGWCLADASFNISSIVIHRGEEPVIGGEQGICNVFFTHCNLQCIYCQNYQISRNTSALTDNQPEFIQILEQITGILDSGIEAVGFVSPSHMVPQIKAIINALHYLRYFPTIVYNSGGFDKVETLMTLEGLIDVYLPDFKYFNASLAKLCSGADDYPAVAVNALKEMFRQKGSTLVCNEEGRAVFGMVIRHLVLPGHVENSLNILRFIAGELSPLLHISLMSQYYPTDHVTGRKLLGRTIYPQEYHLVVDEMEKLGLNNGWIQEMNSNMNYRPDFQGVHPFESNESQT
ncbi:MAG: radical SAM protein [Bacteroidia bacterium]|nr:radical SAM protein [Bacteroidia bacterium]